MRFLTIYQTNWTAPTEMFVLDADSGRQVFVWRFAPDLVECVMLVHSESNSVMSTIGQRRHELPLANYFVIETEISFGAEPNDWSGVHAEVAATFELRCPHILGKRVFEGNAAVPGSFGVAPGWPVTLVSRPGETVEDLAASYEDARVKSQALSERDRNRFALGARWYSKACNAENPIDRFLFLFICLEVFPTAPGSSDVVRGVRDLVHSLLGAGLDARQVTELTGIGRICGLREKIVHDGLATVDYLRDADFRLRLAQLGALVRFCLRVLAGLPPGDELDKYLRPDRSQ